MTKTILLTLLRPFIASLLLSISYLCPAQDRLDSLLHKIDPQRLAESIKKRADKLEEKLIAKSQKTLTKLQKQEEKIYSKMLKGKDSLLAKTKLDEIKAKYGAIQEGLKNPLIFSKGRQYLPRLDSLSTTLKFLDANGLGDKVKNALTKTSALQSKFQQAEEIKKFIKQRREQLKQHLEKFGLVKQLKKFNKELYYYSAQIKEYKEILKDPKKIEKKALELLSKTKLWKDFFRKNSMLAGLFRIQDPDEPYSMANFAGLQTRAQVNAQIQQIIRGAGLNGAEQFRQNMQSAQNQMNLLKSKIIKGGGGSSEDIMPEGFKPNTQKTRSFLQRLEFGTNLQTQKGNRVFPTISDIALSLGYKLNQKSSIGIGASYKLGLGHGFQHIRFTSEGVSIRSFVDWKMKKVFWLSGGFEMNYRSAINNIDQLRTYSAWQKSGLIGISKTVPVKSKFFEKTKVQLLWDLLASQQKPKSQSIIFRIGYSFK